MRLTFLIVFVCVSLAAWAAPSVTVSVEQREVPVGVPFVIRLSAEGPQVGEVRFPEKIDGLRVRKYPVSMANRIEIRNGASSSSVQRDYMAEATRVGKVTVPPLGVEIEGKVVYSEPLELTVTPAVAQTPVHTPADSSEGLTLGDLAFVTSEADAQEVYQGQPVRLVLSVWRIDMPEVDIDSFRSEVEPPRAEGFYTVPRVPAALSQENMTRFDRRYIVDRYQQILYPMRAGTLRIDEWAWEGTLQLLSRYGIQHKELSLRAPAIEIRVKPLPDLQPVGFSGAVGEFDFRGAMLAEAVPQGVPSDLVLRVIGQGNPDAIGEPIVPPVEGLRISQPRKEITPIADPNGVTVEKTFVYSLMPTKAADVVIPQIKFIYFDPQKETFETKTVGPFELHVRPPEESAPRVIVDATNSGLPSAVGMLPAVVDPGPLRPRRSLAVPVTLLVALPPLCYAALGLYVTRKRRFETDIRYARAYHARTRGLRRLAAVREAGEPAEDLFHAVTGFIADKFAVPEGGMTSSDAQELMKSKGVEEDVVSGFARILRACERARYGGESLTEDETEALVLAAHTNMERLEQGLKGVRP